MYDIPRPKPQEPQEQAHSTDQPIAALLPRYYEVWGDNPSYETVRSLNVDGHEIAWLHYGGVTTGAPGEEREYEGHCLRCACDFAEGVGWRSDEKYGAVRIGASEDCPKREAAMRLRHDELYQEYLSRGIVVDAVEPDIVAIKTIMLDLIAKQQVGEWLESTNGAKFWGGHYYVQTVGEIIHAPMDTIWAAANALVAEQRIRLEGAVVQSYREPYTVPVYAETDRVPAPSLKYEGLDKVWALVPRPEESDMPLATLEVTDENRWRVLGRCIVGLAHTAELAIQRLDEAVKHPRLSHSRLYQASFIESARSSGALAVLAYSARRSDQPEEWVIEGFVGDAVAPEVHTIPMAHSSMFGIHPDDYATLNAKVDRWWPRTIPGENSGE